jgi:sulfate adenylyltransferase large subunit
MTETAVASPKEGPSTAIDAFLEQEQRKELLRFTTAGSVDDGKSTLIGRLLYDSQGIYEDQLAAIQNSSINRASGPIDFSLLTDGLKAEREQGITIDVAYRYFSTPKRKFIIADTPGHEQYTRNMATGASTAQLAVVLVDARKGVLPQSRRHAYIASLLGIPYIVVAVNKMDLVGYSAEVFERIVQDFREFAAPLPIQHLHFIPISALEGDNVVRRSERMPWYDGESLLEFLENVPVQVQTTFEDLRFPVQYVIRPSLDFRGFAGQLASGRLRPGDAVMVLPSGRTSRIRRIVTWDGDLSEAFPPMSITVCLEDEIDISRGDMLVNPARMPHVSRRLEAMVVWMHTDPAEIGKPYLIKHTTQQVRGEITAIRYKVDVNTLTHVEARRLELNEIGAIALEVHKPLFFDPYEVNRHTGAFIVIDPISNLTVGAGMISRRPPREEPRRTSVLAGVDIERSRLTPAERFVRLGHHPLTIWMTARIEVAYMLERELFDRGCFVHVLADDVESHALPDLARMSAAAGLITICSIAGADEEDRDRAREMVGAERFVEIDPASLPPDDAAAARFICQLLEQRGLIPPDQRGLEGEGI